MSMRWFWVTLLTGFFLVGCQTLPEGGSTAADYYNRGQSAYLADDYDLAIADFQEALRLDPRYADAYYGLGLAYEATNRTQLALDAYLSAIRLQPSHGESQARSGILYFERRQYGPAESHLRRATALVPYDPMPFYYLGEINRMQGRCQASVDNYKKALDIDPNLLDAEDGLRRVRREVCGAGSKPTRQSEFTGGGRALKPSEW